VSLIALARRARRRNAPAVVAEAPPRTTEQVIEQAEQDDGVRVVWTPPAPPPWARPGWTPGRAAPRPGLARALELYLARLAGFR